MKLHQFPLSPDCQKVVALAHEVGVPLEVCGGLEVGFYRVHDDGRARFFALHVLETRAGSISMIDHLMSKGPPLHSKAGQRRRRITNGMSRSVFCW
jgi:hypothetical protein